MNYITRTQDQIQALAYQKKFLTDKFDFEVLEPQFDKVPHASTQLKFFSSRGLVSQIEEILLHIE